MIRLLRMYDDWEAGVGGFIEDYERRFSVHAVQAAQAQGPEAAAELERQRKVGPLFCRSPGSVCALCLCAPLGCT